MKEATLSLYRMCEVILEARILNKRFQTGRQIFNYSPTGELYMIWEWYSFARDFLDDIQKKYYHYGATSDDDPCMYCGKPFELQSRTTDLSTELCIERKRIVENGGGIDYPIIEWKTLPKEQDELRQVLESLGIEVLENHI